MSREDNPENRAAKCLRWIREQQPEFKKLCNNAIVSRALSEIGNPPTPALSPRPSLFNKKDAVKPTHHVDPMMKL